MHKRIDKRALHNYWNTFRVESLPNSVRVNTIPFWACAPAVCGETLQILLRSYHRQHFTKGVDTRSLHWYRSESSQRGCLSFRKIGSRNCRGLHVPTWCLPNRWVKNASLDLQNIDFVPTTRGGEAKPRFLSHIHLSLPSLHRSCV